MANGQINAGPAARLMSVAVGRGRTRRSARVGRGAQSCTVPSDDGQNTASDLGTTSKLLPSTVDLSPAELARYLSLTRTARFPPAIARQPAQCPRPAFPLSVLAAQSQVGPRIPAHVIGRRPKMRNRITGNARVDVMRERERSNEYVDGRVGLVRTDL